MQNIDLKFLIKLRENPRYKLAVISSNNHMIWIILSIYQEIIDEYETDFEEYSMINITCDKFTYSDNWGLGKCFQDTQVDYGSYTTVNGAKIQYTFNGTGVYLSAFKREDSGTASIRIDGTFVEQINLSSGKSTREESFFENVFISDDLEYGEHTIEVENTGKNQSIVLNSLYIKISPRWAKLDFKYFKNCFII